jgi:uncharacterized membrane protein
MHRLGCLILCLALLLAGLLPAAFPGVMESAFEKLGTPPDLALFIFLAILIGSAVNVPVARIPSKGYLCRDPLAVLGLGGLLPRLQERQKQRLVAINVGGGLIPLAVAAYQVVHLIGLVSSAAAVSPESASLQGTLIAAFLTVMINVFVCWKIARPIPGVGIAVPGLVPGLLAAASALFFAGEFAPPVAYIAGVLGPLIGADLLHLGDLQARPVGLASIGGAGTFDGIVLSAVLSLFLG